MEKIGGTGSVLSDYYSDATRGGRQIKFAKLPLDYSAIPPIPCPVFAAPKRIGLKSNRRASGALINRP
jgi:hypothetical protein